MLSPLLIGVDCATRQFPKHTRTDILVFAIVDETCSLVCQFWHSIKTVTLQLQLGNVAKFGRIGLCLSWMTSIDRYLPAGSLRLIVCLHLRQAFRSEIDSMITTLEHTNWKDTKRFASSVGKRINPHNFRRHGLVSIQRLHVLYSLISRWVTTHALAISRLDHTMLITLLNDLIWHFKLLHHAWLFPILACPWERVVIQIAYRCRYDESQLWHKPHLAGW